MLTGCDAGRDVRRTKAGRRCEQHDVNATVDHLLICIETAELLRLFDFYTIADLLNTLQRAKASVDVRLIDIGDGYEFRVVIGVQGLRGSAGASTSASH